MSQWSVRLGVMGVAVLTACGTGVAAAPGGGEDATATDAAPPEASADVAMEDAVDPGAPLDAASEWTFVRPGCGGYDSGAGCPGDEAATLSSPKVLGGEGGAPAPGRDATVSVVLTASAMGIEYPCVGFAA
ncbi:MAG: hypothetical protein ACRENE_20115, partial [Polyangiaceae bacterium]